MTAGPIGHKRRCVILSQSVVLDSQEKLGLGLEVLDSQENTDSDCTGCCRRKWEPAMVYMVFPSLNCEVMIVV